MLEKLENLDTTIFWFINSHHCNASDWVLWVISQGWSWPIVIVAAMLVVCKRIGWRKWWLVLLGIGLCFLLGDRISVMCFKDVFMRLRPCHAMEGVRMFMTRCGGQYGFVSSHAANSTAVALFLCLLHKSACSGRNRRHGFFVALMSLWVILVGYSRPYLGKHYPGDVVCGALLGIAVGAVVYFLYKKCQRHEA